jgi:hypothetical protein
MEKWDAKVFDRNNPRVGHGEVIVELCDGLNVVKVSVENVLTRDESLFTALPFVARLRMKPAQFL